jgi:hypothetical protein
MNVSLILKALGIKIPDDALRKIETLIPQIPGRVSQAIEVVNSTIKQADERMSALEASNARIIEQNKVIQAALSSLLEAKESNGKRARSVANSGAGSPSAN